ncbi:response regulator transcription factor [Paenibacillus guangzhouensis]|uniref:response regulator transcription factor n=1 Tax=Paenibacillus guangzhouensis TaxID=1473112 RepID=UPI0012674862|nr:response regulator [Paenibacillus guangzhouensis]
MFKIMLIDDDVPMLKVLQQMMDWEQLSLSLIGSAYSSVKALQMFKELLPDIVITDIGMPQMDGLQLSAEFKKIKPNVRIIFLMCHEDFHYAKQVLAMNADGYLIKDELTAMQLEKSLMKSIQSIQAMVAMSEQNSYREQFKRNIDVFKQSFYQRLLAGNPAQLLLQYAKQLEIRWDYPMFMIASGSISLTGTLQRYSYHDISTLRYGIYNIAQELSRTYDGITVFTDQAEWAFVLNYRQSLTFNAQQYLHRYLEKLSENCEQYLKVKLRYVLYTNKLEIEQLGGTLRQMQKEKYYAYYADEAIMTWEMAKLKPKYGDAKIMLQQERDELIRAVQALQTDQSIASLEKLFQKAKTEQLDPMELVQECSRTMRLIEMQSTKAMIDNRYYTYLDATMHAEDTKMMMAMKLYALLGNTKLQASTKAKNMKLQEIDQYLLAHLSENVTSVDVAQHLYLNPSYFSRYFKRMTDENFTDYVHRFKMKAAMRMLEYPDETIEMISLKLGYSDRTYFTKVFKKYIDMTPGEYKSKMSSGL